MVRQSHWRGELFDGAALAAQELGRPDLGKRFAKVARDYRTGLKSMISGPFFIGSLVGVGCRLMVLGPGLGTLVGTLEPTPMCAYQAHIVLR